MALTVKIGDVYGLTYVASVANNWSATLKVRNRHGVVRKYAYRQPAATADRTAQSFTTERIAEDGDIVGFAAAVGSVAATKRGQFYMNVFVLGDSASGDVEVNVAKGYVYDGKSLALGDSVEPGPGGGEGVIRTVTGANPAAGAESSEAVPTNAVWNLLAYSIVLVTDANVADRRVHLVIDDGAAANRRFLTGVGTNQTATQTLTHLFVRHTGGAVYATADINLADTDTVLATERLPADMGILSEGYRIRTVTSGIVAGDNFAAPIFQVEEWLVL